MGGEDAIGAFFHAGLLGERAAESNAWAAAPGLLIAHDLVRKPVPTFRDHAR
jgi:hypothetical protein